MLATLGLLFRTSTVRVLERTIRSRRAHAGERFPEERGFSLTGRSAQAARSGGHGASAHLVRANTPADPRRGRARARTLDALLDEVGLADPRRKVALVDIGHHGSLQVALSRLLRRTDLVGYYFATTARPPRATHLAGQGIKSYLLDFEDPAASDHPYVRNVGAFEFLFLPPEPSFMRFVETSGGLEPVFAEADERPRFEVVREVQRGVLDFVHDAVYACWGQALRLRCPRTTRRDPSFELGTTDPDLADAALLLGVGFGERTRTHEVRYLIAPSELAEQQVVELAEGRGRGRHWPPFAWCGGAPTREPPGSEKPSSCGATPRDSSPICAGCACGGRWWNETGQRVGFRRRDELLGLVGEGRALQHRDALGQPRELPWKPRATSGSSAPPRAAAQLALCCA